MISPFDVKLIIMPYYATVPMFPEEIRERIEKAKNQDELVMEAFWKAGIPMGPSMVYKYLINTGKITAKVPITSIRRSIHDLTKEGQLVKTERTVMGSFGSKEHQWKLA